MNLYTEPEVSDIYRGFERVLIEQHRVDKALEVGEQGRAKGFADFLTSRLPARSPFIPSVSPLSIYQIKRLAKEQNSTLVEYSLVYDYEKFYEESQDDLGIHGIYTYAQELLIWVISPQGRISFKQVDLTTLLEEYQISFANLVRTVREAIALGDDYLSSIPANFRAYGLNEQLQLLYQVLIEPIAHFLPKETNSRIAIIPQDFLFLVPFAALQDRKGQWLISKYSLLSSPSLHVLEWMRQKRQRLSLLHVAIDLPVSAQFKTSMMDPLCDRQNCHSREGGNPLNIDRTAKLPLNLYPALVLGNPTMPSFSMYFGEAPVYFTRLPGAELEAKAVAKVLNVTPLTNDAATRKAVLAQMSGAKIIHLATHTCLGYRECFQGILALAPDAQGKNGFLALRDIFSLSRDRKKLPLSADLVCLSGCDLVRGQIWGDGVFQISQGFLVAGASSVMMSLWLPPAASSPAMMKQFYQQFQATGDKAQSLRQAMLTTLEKFPEPKYWAGFTLFGCG